MTITHLITFKSKNKKISSTVVTHRSSKGTDKYFPQITEMRQRIWQTRSSQLRIGAYPRSRDGKLSAELFENQLSDNLRFAKRKSFTLTGTISKSGFLNF
jgi:hypothetical protein